MYHCVGWAQFHQQKLVTYYSDIKILDCMYNVYIPNKSIQGLHRPVFLRFQLSQKKKKQTNQLSKREELQHQNPVTYEKPYSSFVGQKCWAQQFLTPNSLKLLVNCWENILLGSTVLAQQKR